MFDQNAHFQGEDSGFDLLRWLQYCRSSRWSLNLGLLVLHGSSKSVAQSCSLRVVSCWHSERIWNRSAVALLHFLKCLLKKRFCSFPLSCWWCQTFLFRSWSVLHFFFFALLPMTVNSSQYSCQSNYCGFYISMSSQPQCCNLECWNEMYEIHSSAQPKTRYFVECW